MSKAVRWKIEFVSNIEKTKYRIDIYAEQDGTWSGVTQLLGGPQPFVTEENKSDDFFTPVRSQTGNIQVCTAIPAGGTLSLDDILPANNIDHPVRLVSIAANNAETIEWQGFLSCEAYSQSYTSIPQILTLPVISVLEAMKSVFINKDEFAPLGTIGCLIARTIAHIPEQIIDYLYFPIESWSILKKQINISSFFNKAEYQQRERTIYELKGISLQETLEMICKYMGWTVREQNKNIYFQQQQGSGNMYEISRQYFVQEDGDVDTSDFFDAGGEVVDMSDLIWRGIEHHRSVSQGAHSVQVSAQLVDFDVNSEIPPFPYSDLFTELDNGTNKYVLPSADDEAYSNLEFHHYKANVRIFDSPNYAADKILMGEKSNSDSSLTISYSSLYQDAPYDCYADAAHAHTIYAGAFLTKLEIGSDYTGNHENAKDGLFISLFGGLWKEHTDYTLPILKMKSVQVFAAYESGYICIDAKFLSFFNDKSYQATGDPQCRLMVDLNIGGKVWTGTQWVDESQYTEHFFIATTNDKFSGNWNSSMGIDQTDGLLIPVTSDIRGEIVFSIYPETKFFDPTTGGTGAWRRLVYGMFFSELSVSYIPLRTNFRTDRKSNEYYNELATSFRNDIQKTVNIASFMHNSPSPSLLYNTDNSPMQVLEFAVGENTIKIPPEQYLLNRMSAYYGAARQTLELKVKHPTVAALPLLKLNGISPDTKKYLPLAESRDWIADVATLTCFETPE